MKSIVVKIHKLLTYTPAVYLNHFYSVPCLFTHMWLVILNKRKVAHEMILKKRNKN